MSRAAQSTAAVTITAGGESLATRLREVLRYRDLLLTLVRRDLAVRYKQTLLGAAWAIVQPVMFAIIFSVFLGLIFDRAPSGDIPYPVFLLCGFTLWFYFSEATSQGSTSTISAANLISKVYFPRVIIPLAAVLVPSLNFVFSFAVLIVTMLIYGLVPPWQVVLVPLVFAMTVMIAAGTSFFLSALVVRFRDVALGIPFLIQILLYASAIIYPLSLVPESTQELLAINPMIGLMETFRWAVLPGAESPGMLWLIPLGFGLALVVAGLLYFERAERDFADLI